MLSVSQVTASCVPEYLSELGPDTYSTLLRSVLTSHLIFNPMNRLFAFNTTHKLKNALTFPLGPLP